MTGILTGCGISSFVCSSGDVDYIRQYCQAGNNRIDTIVVDNVVPVWFTTSDPGALTCTPQQAVGVGCDYIIVGEPLVKPGMSVGTCVDAAGRIIKEIEQA